VCVAYCPIALTHGLIGVAAGRLLLRAGLDSDPVRDTDDADRGSGKAANPETGNAT